MRPDNRAVDHHVVVVTIGGQMPVDVFSVTKTDRRVGQPSGRYRLIAAAWIAVALK
ncbi:hypothetical protein SXCC_00449 [Gluconacetobacter sp. SXCC-1]|nr:hypothetical protein SXCC_00449 [Gluconacetobacter sp. SXCC-1]